MMLGFKVDPALVAALDAEAIRQTKARPTGHAKVSRTEVVKGVLYAWLAQQQKRAK